MCLVITDLSSFSLLLKYMEFAAYAALLSGAPPPVLTKSLVVRHHQTWKLREHHLLGPDPSHSDSGIEVDSDNIDSLPAGDPLRSYFPTGTVLKEHRNGIEVKVPGVKEIIRYQRASVTESQYSDDERTRPYVQDVIITGEVSSTCHSDDSASSSFSTGPFSMGSIQPRRSCEGMRWVRQLLQRIRM